MALDLVSTHDERLVGQAVGRAVRMGLENGGAVLLVPSFDEALEASKALADAGLGMGVQTTTPRAWARDRWDVWGDGRRVVEDAARTLVMTEVLRASGSGSAGEVSPGLVGLLCDLADRCLPWVAQAMGGARDALTDAELVALSLLPRYEARLDELGLVECSRVMELLPRTLVRAGVGVGHVVVAGFDELPLAERMLLVDLAQTATVTVVARHRRTAAGELVRRSMGELRGLADQRGVEVVEADEHVVAGATRDGELDALLEALFEAGEDGISPRGAVRLLEPSGPLSEAELVARASRKLAAEGLRTQVVVVPDVRRAWRELAPKLVARGIAVHAQLSVPVLSTDAGRAFMGYARTVARLQELAATWPQPVPCEEGEVARLGDMSWWPPHELADFLLCDIAHTSADKARALALAWRANRLLTPADVLARLLSAKACSDPVERATRELLRGRLGSAASKLLAPYEPGKPSSGPTSLAREEDVAVLAAILGVAGTLKELGVTADPSTEGHVSLTALVDAAGLMLRSQTVRLRPCVEPQRPLACVRILSRTQAARLAPASADALIVCGLTSEELAVPSADNVATSLLHALGLESVLDPLVAQRTWWARVCAVPRRRLLLERALFSADAKETYPAVMLTEVLACYAGSLSRSTLAEDEARANVAVLGQAPHHVAREVASPSGRIDEDLRRLVTVPQEGTAELPDGLPVLSASQIESYLECPLKWFSLRRLRLRDNDALFSPLEMGTFAHRVLELAYSQLVDEACADAALSPEAAADPLVPLPMRGMSSRDEQGLAHAREVIAAIFAVHARHQRLRTGGKPAYQALIAHSSQEESQMDRLRRDLLSLPDYEAVRLAGFEPRLFEWDFGKHEPVSYAGVRVMGTIDRVDVDAHGQAIVIDYKHKGPAGFFAEYAALPAQQDEDAPAYELPHRIQALLYAQVLRRAFPQLKVVGALYLGTRGTHELSGAVAQNQAERVFGGTLSSRRAKRVVVDEAQSFGMADAHGMEALLDATEQAIAAEVARLRVGDIPSRPRGASSCAYCPVMNCDRRLA